VARSVETYPGRRVRHGRYVIGPCVAGVLMQTLCRTKSLQRQIDVLPNTTDAWSQAQIAAFRSRTAGSAITDDASLHQWLAAGFWALPTDRHRHMFLDAATLMHAQPLEARHSLGSLFERLMVDPQPLRRVRTLQSRNRTVMIITCVSMLQELRCAWTAMVQLDDGCEEDVAARRVDACLAELVASSLVSVSEGFYRTTWWEGSRGCERAPSASFMASSACDSEMACACTAPRCDICVQLCADSYRL